MILGKYNRSAIGTLVERTTRFTVLLHLPGDHTAVTVRDAMITAMGQIPQLLRKTLTWDQGPEMAEHLKIADALDLDIYFCDPASPWQRGSNENTNGLLRQYFPQRQRPVGLPPRLLAFVAAQLNDRPRKTLGWKTPRRPSSNYCQTHPSLRTTALIPPLHTLQVCIVTGTHVYVRSCGQRRVWVSPTKQPQRSVARSSTSLVWDSRISRSAIWDTRNGVVPLGRICLFGVAGHSLISEAWPIRSTTKIE